MDILSLISMTIGVLVLAFIAIDASLFRVRIHHELQEAAQVLNDLGETMAEYGLSLSVHKGLLILKTKDVSMSYQLTDWALMYLSKDFTFYADRALTVSDIDGIVHELDYIYHLLTR